MPQLCNLTAYLDRVVFTDKDKLSTKIIVKQHMGIIAEMKEKLDDWELDLFKRSYFGHFLELDPE